MSSRVRSSGGGCCICRILGSSPRFGGALIERLRGEEGEEGQLGGTRFRVVRVTGNAKGAKGVLDICFTYKPSREGKGGVRATMTLLEHAESVLSICP